MIISKVGKAAIANYEVLNEDPLISFLGVKPETRRTHQIRIHLAAKGHSVLGGQTYGGRNKQLIKVNHRDQQIGLGGN